MKIEKIKALILKLNKTDLLDIDLSILQSLDSDKILKLYNVLTQLVSLVESGGLDKNEFKRFLLKEEIKLIII